MGLTIHYSFETNKKTSVKQAQKIAEDMWNYALSLKNRGALEEVSELTYVGEAEFAEIRNLDRAERMAHPLGWASIQATEHFSKKVVIGKTSGNKRITKDIYKNLYPLEGFMFTTYPGEGSEEANFGLMRYPSEITLNVDELYDYRIPNPLKEMTIRTGYKAWGWSWGSFCKTQYASNYGLTNFAQCHIAVCAMLDHIYMNDRLNLEVSDEGGYWDNRSVQKLIQEVGDWNQMIAAFAGVMLDAKNTPELKDTTLIMPIIENPQFEVLETEGRNKLPKSAQTIMEALIDVLRLKEVESKLPKDEK